MDAIANSPKDDVFAALTLVLSSYLSRKRRLPEFMPQDAAGAAAWWTTMQEPADERFESPRQVTVSGRSESTRWDFPYIRRVTTTLRIFLRLPADRQRFVVAAREDGYWWRGEHEDVWKDGRKLWLFLLVIEQYEVQKRLGADAYRQKAMAAMKDGLRKIGEANAVTGKRRAST